MLVFIVFGCVLLYYIFNKKPVNIFNPMVMFTALWTLILCLSNLQLYGLYDFSNSAEQLIELGTVFFGLAFIIYSEFIKLLHPNRLHHNLSCSTNVVPRYLVLYFLGLVCLMYFLPTFLSSIEMLIKGGSFNTIRIVVQSETDGSGINNLLQNFIVLPSAIVIEIVAVVDFWFGRRDRLLFILNMIIIFMRIIADGGRTPIVDLLIYMALGYLLFRRQGKHIVFGNKELQVKVKRYFILIFIVIFIITLSRTSSTIFRQFYFYFAMTPVLLTKWMRIVDGQNFITHGLSSTNGLWFTLSYFLKNLFGIDYFKSISDSYAMIALTDSRWLPIAIGNINANAYVSAFWFLYTDARLLGVLVGMFLYGLIVARSYWNIFLRFNQQSISIYFLIYQGLIFSFIRMPFAKPYYVIALVILLIIFRKDGKQEKLTIN